MARPGDDKAWEVFVSWCGARGLKALPANPWTLAAYARWCESRHPYPAIAKAVRAIGRVHNTKSRRRPERHPLVLRTLKLIEARAKTGKRPGAKRLELFPEGDLAGDAAPGGAKKPAGARKRAPASDGKTRRAGLSPSPKLVPRRRLKG